MANKDEGSGVGSFELDGKFYFHNIFTQDDDRVECTDEDNNLILTFTSNCYVLDKDKKQIGHTSMKHGGWVFTPTDSEESFNVGRHLLNGEMHISVWYLSKQKEANG